MRNIPSRQMEALVRDWHGAGDGRIRIDYNIHSEYLSTETVCRDILDIVRGTDLRLHIHLSETEKEVRECRERTAASRRCSISKASGLSTCR